ncbi:MAG: SDR family oxidoreductase [Acidobacteria bacterium]|nr:SDR family oxidoreductase [Acidobacteriota bacterium]
MKILVLGGTGSLGRLIVSQGLELEFGIRVLVRDAEKFQLEHHCLEVMPGNALDAAAVERALVGCDAVIYALGSRQSGFFADTTRILIAAMEKAGVRRLVAITGIGAGDSKGHGGWIYDWIVYPLFTKKIYANKDVQEQLIRASKLDWIIVRPAAFTNGPLGGRLRALDQLEGVTISSISRADAAAFALDQLTSDQWLKKTPLVGY